MREHLQLPRDINGRIFPEEIQSRCKNYVVLDGFPSEENEDVAPVGASGVPEIRASESSSQPDGGRFPSDVPSSISPSPSSAEDPEEPEVPSGPIDTPVPDWNDDDEVVDDNLLFGDDLEVDVGGDGVWEVMFGSGPEADVVDVCFCETPEILEWANLATTARKQRVEVQWRSLNDQDRKLFAAAKDKEVKAWVDHGTVKKDPQLSSIAADAPTLTKDGKQLLLQQVASRGWRLINFDISTAFLKGAGDGRQLGIHPPVELQQALAMQEGDQCSLVGGAYGRADAPILWYRTLKSTLESLGFVVCPFDGCVFSLITLGKDGRPRVHGCLGMHVDDGIGGGDQYFREVIGRLRKIYEFGAYNEGEFEFCGVRYFQWDDGSIEMEQNSYIQKISPIEIPKGRRLDPKSRLNETETQWLRQICGSLQFAAVHTRPDLAAKVGELQTAIPHGRIEHLLNANRTLYEAKSHPVALMIVKKKWARAKRAQWQQASGDTWKSFEKTQVFWDGMTEDERRKIKAEIRSMKSDNPEAFGADFSQLLSELVENVEEQVELAAEVPQCPLRSGSLGELLDGGGCSKRRAVPGKEWLAFTFRAYWDKRRPHDLFRRSIQMLQRRGGACAKLLRFSDWRCSTAYSGDVLRFLGEHWEGGLDWSTVPHWSVALSLHRGTWWPHWGHDRRVDVL
eukprot:s2451_g9.t1